MEPLTGPGMSCFQQVQPTAIGKFICTGWGQSEKKLHCYVKSLLLKYIFMKRTHASWNVGAPLLRAEGNILPKSGLYFGNAFITGALGVSFPHR